MDNLLIESAIASVYLLKDESDDVDSHQMLATRLGVSRDEAKILLYKHLFSCPFFRGLLKQTQEIH